jgi:IS4 transposase
MNDRLSSLSPVSLMNEVSDADLGDERLNRRFVELMGGLACKPGAPISKVFERESDLEAAYRFLRNPAVDSNDLLQPHIEETALRCDQVAEVVIAHDTTTHVLSERAHIESFINTGKRGFFSHVSLAIESKGEGRPLGVVAMEALFRKKKGAKARGQKGRKRSGAETARLKTKEYDRWARGIDVSVRHLKQPEKAVHVIDREGDSYDLFGYMHACRHNFVIRECKNRLARTDDSDDWERTHSVLDKAKRTRIRRKVFVGKRRRKSAPNAAKKHPPRKSRVAQLKVAYTKMAGEQRIEWTLLTTLPVNNAIDAERIVDIYRKRWLIEEFFAALKGGCAYRKRELTNRFSIQNTLAVLIPIAWKALDLRHLARCTSEKASGLFSEIELKALRAKARQLGLRLGRHPTAEKALAVIARLGGHQKTSGPPGWKALMSGMDRFLTIVEGYALAYENM